MCGFLNSNQFVMRWKSVVARSRKFLYPDLLSGVDGVQKGHNGDQITTYDIIAQNTVLTTIVQHFQEGQNPLHNGSGVAQW